MTFTKISGQRASDQHVLVTGLGVGQGCLRSRRHYHTGTYSKVLGISFKWFVLLQIAFYTAVVSGIQLPKCDMCFQDTHIKP